MPWQFFGFAWLYLMLSVKALNLEEGEMTVTNSQCQQGSQCSSKNTMPSGSFVQSRAVGGKNDVMETDVNGFDETLVEKMETESNSKSTLASMAVEPGESCVGNCQYCKPHGETDRNVFNDMPLCANGEYQWACLSGGRGPRVQCPAIAPIMCAYKKCDGDLDYCCEVDCGKVGSEPFGGPRLCDSSEATTQAPQQKVTTSEPSSYYWRDGKDEDLAVWVKVLDKVPRFKDVELGWLGPPVSV